MNEPNYIVRLERQVSKLGIEIESLRRWKREAIEVLDEWDETWIAADKPDSLGKSKAQGVKELVESLRQRVKELEERNIEYARTKGELLGMYGDLEAELAALKAGQGEPVAQICSWGCQLIGETADAFKKDRIKFMGTPLYTSAPTIPEGWKPIETVPKNESLVLIAGQTADDSWVFGVGRYLTDFCEVCERGTLATGWKYWMPLPAAPKPEESLSPNVDSAFVSLVDDPEGRN